MASPTSPRTYRVPLTCQVNLNPPGCIVRQAQDSGRPVVLTRYGRGVAVLLSVDAYEELEGSAARARLVSGIREAEAAVERGDVVSDDDMNVLMDSWEAEEA